MEDPTQDNIWFEEDPEGRARDDEEKNVKESVQEQGRISRRTLLKVLGVGALGTAFGYQQWRIEKLQHAIHQDGVPEVVQKVAPSTAMIMRLQEDADGLPHESSGSGFFVRDSSRQLHLLTKTHVIWPPRLVRRAEDRGECIIIPYGETGREFLAEVARLPNGQDATVTSLLHDMTMLKIPDEVVVPHQVGLKLRDLASRPLELGEKVAIVGAPFALEGSVTTGIVSAVQRAGAIGNPLIPYIQIDAAAHPGSSGSPVVDMQGEVIGVVKAVYPFNGSYAENVVFALRVDALEEILKGWGIEV